MPRVAQCILETKIIFSNAGIVVVNSEVVGFGGGIILLSIMDNNLRFYGILKSYNVINKSLNLTKLGFICKFRPKRIQM
jgi:hypothetical protein